jgi:hypothetical protein
MQIYEIIPYNGIVQKHTTKDARWHNDDNIQQQWTKKLSFTL